jgi:hypothetical protein
MKISFVSTIICINVHINVNVTHGCFYYYYCYCSWCSPVALDLTLSSRPYENGGTAKTSAEGQGQPWALEPVVMMITIMINVKV